MSIFQKIIESIKTFNTDSPFFTSELKSKVGILNLVILSTLPIIFTAIIYLYFIVGSLAKSIAISIYFISLVIYLFLKDKPKLNLYIINVGFFLPTIILISNLFSLSNNFDIELSHYVIAKTTLVTSFILATIFIPTYNKRIQNFAIFYNLFILLFFELILSLFNVDFSSIGKFRELLIGPYNIIIYIFNVNILVIAILLFIYNKINQIKINLFEDKNNKLQTNINTLTDRIKTLSIDKDNTLNELDYLLNNRFNFVINWKELFLDKTFAYFELEFESQHIELDNANLITNEVINTFKIIEFKEDNDIKFKHYLPRILRILIPKYFSEKNNLIDLEIDELYVNKFKYSFIPKKEGNKIISFFILIHKKLQDFQITNNYDPVSKFHIFNNLDDYVLAFDKDGKIIYVNKTVLDSLSYSKGEFDNVDIFDLSDSFRKTRFSQFLSNVKNDTYEKSITLIGKLGEKIYLDITINQFLVEEYEYFILIGRDNLSYLEIIQEIQHKDDEYNKLLNVSKEVIFKSVVDSDWTILFITDNVYELTGYEKHKFYTNEITFDKIILDKDKEKVWEEILKSVNENTSYDVQYGIRTKQGKVKLIREVGYPIQNTEDNEINLFGYLEDLSEESSYKNIISDLEDRFLKVIENIPTMISIYDIKGKPQFCNSAFIEFFGMKEHYEAYLNSYNLLEDDRVKENKELFDSIKKAMVGEKIENLTYTLYDVNYNSPKTNTIEFKAKILPYYEKSTFNQMIIFIIESIKILD